MAVSRPSSEKVAMAQGEDDCESVFSPRKARSGQGTLGWFQSMMREVLTDNCANRLQEMVGFTPRQPTGRAGPLTMTAALESSSSPSPEDRVASPFEAMSRAAPSGQLPSDFFQSIAQKAVRDPFIASQWRADDLAGPPCIWCQAHTLRLQFLQMCVRDRQDLCQELWLQLAECHRRAYWEVYQHGAPAKFFETVINDMDDQDMYSDIASEKMSTISCREGTWQLCQSKEGTWDAESSLGPSISREGTYGGPSQSKQVTYHPRRAPSQAGSRRSSERSNLCNSKAAKTGCYREVRLGHSPTKGRRLGQWKKDTLERISWGQKLPQEGMVPREWTGRSNLTWADA